MRRIVYTLILAWLAVSVGFVLMLRWVAPPTTLVMLLEPGPVSEIDYRWVDRAEISLAAAHAAIAAEDQKFLSHHGFDFDELAYALAVYDRGGPLRGASTISQQVAKNLFLWNGRSFTRKALEAYFALLIELCWSKERILEVYLNVAEFGRGVFGVEAAADHFFGKSARELTEADAAALTAVLPSPKRMSVGNPSVYVWQRQIEIMTQIGTLEERGHYRGLDW